jgi:hypothetical protein
MQAKLISHTKALGTILMLSLPITSVSDIEPVQTITIDASIPGAEEHYHYYQHFFCEEHAS